MGTTEFDGVKGFLPQEEALQLLEWASQGALIGPLLEIGSYCGLSTLWLAKAARAAKTVVFAVDHHRGSEEHQAGEFFHYQASQMFYHHKPLKNFFSCSLHLPQRIIYRLKG